MGSSAKERISRMKNSVDIVALSFSEGEVFVLLVRRGHPAFEGSWALPGGHVGEDEDLEDAARREFLEETSIETVGMAQIGTFGAPNRDPRGRIISTAFLVILPTRVVPTACDDAVAAGWFPLARLPPLAFDHTFILELAASKIRFSVNSNNIKLAPEVRQDAVLFRMAGTSVSKTT